MHIWTVFTTSVVATHRSRKRRGVRPPRRPLVSSGDFVHRPQCRRRGGGSWRVIPVFPSPLVTKPPRVTIIKIRVVPAVFGVRNDRRAMNRDLEMGNAMGWGGRHGSSGLGAKRATRRESEIARTNPGSPSDPAKIARTNPGLPRDQAEIARTNPGSPSDPAKIARTNPRPLNQGEAKRANEAKPGKSTQTLPIRLIAMTFPSLRSITGFRVLSLGDAAGRKPRVHVRRK